MNSTHDTSKFRGRRFAPSIFTLLVIAATVLPARAEVIHAFDPAAGEFPESVATDLVGNVYFSLTGPAGTIGRVTPSGEMRIHFALEPAPSPDSFGILGLTIGPWGKVYAAVASFDPATHGVWRIDANGNGVRIPGTQAITMPNDLTFDHRGRIYVTDTLGGAVWRINVDGEVAPWVEDPLLLGDGSSGRPVPLGANGIDFHADSLFIAVTEGARVVSVKIMSDGSSGQLEVMAEHPDLFLIDGIAADKSGRLLGAIVALNGTTFGRVMQIERGAAPEELLGPGDGLQLPTSIAFGRAGSEANKLFVANWDLAAGDLGATPMPALHQFEIPPPLPPLPEVCLPFVPTP